MTVISTREEQAFWDDQFEAEAQRIAGTGTQFNNPEKIAEYCSRWADSALNEPRQRQPSNGGPLGIYDAGLGAKQQ